MKTNGIVCDACKGKMLSAGGYYINASPIIDGLHFIVVPASTGTEASAFQHHVCGKGCLIDWFNVAMDNLPKAEKPMAVAA